MTLPADLYVGVAKVGAGRYSTVFAATDISAGQRICVKEMHASGGDSLAGRASVKSVLREILALKRLSGCRNVVQMHSVKRRDEYFYIEMELMDLSLDDFIQLADISFSEIAVRSICAQVAIGLNECHSRGVVHRDIKPGNILLSRTGDIKLCDFGLARIAGATGVIQGEGSNEICTRWYKPIEVLLGSVMQSAAIDVWSFGCVVAELFRLGPLFQGSSDIHQLFLIQSALGPASVDRWPSITQCSDFGKVEFDISDISGLNPLVDGASADVMSLLTGCLEYDPSKRFSIADCIVHVWMNGKVLSQPDLVDLIGDIMSNSSFAGRFNHSIS